SGQTEGHALPRYKVRVWDNFHYQDPAETWDGCVYDNAAEALASCRRLVDTSLKALHKPGVSAESLFDSYTSFGDDPSIVVIDGVDTTVQFSAWTYAKERCREICGDAPPASTLPPEG
ncbi:MAG: hypothetical protein WA581_01115, partial [Candidatus Acidiferrales bacterium]